MLTNRERREIAGLKELCEAHDGIKLKLNEDWLALDHPEGLSIFTSYEDEKLVGFLGLYSFGETTEACGMVHPDYRRAGIFHDLFRQAFASGITPGSRLLLNCPTGSKAGKAFLKQLSCHYLFSEYQMVWEPRAFENDEVATIRKARPQDRDIEIKLDVEAFGTSQKEAEGFWRQLQQESSRSFYIIETEGQPVGKLSVQRVDNTLWVYGFAVLPAFQGKGIGRSALQQVLTRESKSKRDIHLEVQADNEHALELYRNCGFRTYHAQDYFLYQWPSEEKE